MRTKPTTRVPAHKNIASMTDAEFDAFLNKLMNMGLTAKRINAIIEADCNAVCPVTVGF